MKVVYTFNDEERDEVLHRIRCIDDSIDYLKKNYAPDRKEPINILLCGLKTEVLLLEQCFNCDLN
ncbi:MAG: hypothetical protein WCO84_01035 [bacterium]